MVSENRQSRERFEGIASRTVSAITQGDTNDLSNIIRDVTGEGKEGGAVSVEAGDSNGAAGDQLADTPPARDAEEHSG